MSNYLVSLGSQDRDPGPGPRDRRRARRFSISTCFDDERNMSFCGAGTAIQVSYLCTCARSYAQTPMSNGHRGRPVYGSPAAELPQGPRAENRLSGSPRTSSKIREKETLQSPAELWWGRAGKAGTPCTVICQCQETAAVGPDVICQ